MSVASGNKGRSCPRPNFLLRITPPDCAGVEGIRPSYSRAETSRAASTYDSSLYPRGLSSVLCAWLKSISHQPARRAKATLTARRPRLNTTHALQKCTSCGTTSTPVWRWGGESKEVLLCNACSLRIRRSAGRPQSLKTAATDNSGQKHSPGIVSTDSGSPTSERVLAELSPTEAEALRQQLLERVEFHLNQEKMRLLGPRELPAAEEEWSVCPSTTLHEHVPEHSTADALHMH